MSSPSETTEDQEEAVARMMKYDFISLPVVDKEGRLVGIVTVDDRDGRHGGGGHRGL